MQKQQHSNSMDLLLGSEIGRGGFGTVFVKSDNPSLCIKVSNKGMNNNSTCRQWSDEFKKITDMMKNIHMASKSSPSKNSINNLKHVRIIEPTDFIKTDGACYMVSPRIYRPEGRSLLKPTLQAQFGAASCNTMFKGRGEFIGVQQIKKYVNADTMPAIAHELGLVMGMIHFRGKNDGYDIEVFMGKEANSKKVRFYIADFDLSNPITSYDDATIQRMRWSMDAVPYFPRPDLDAKMFAAFKNAYAFIAQNDVLVEKIFHDYG